MIPEVIHFPVRQSLIELASATARNHVMSGYDGTLTNLATEDF